MITLEKGKHMVARLVFAAVATMMFGSVAFADYYVIQEQTTKQCKIVEPKEATWLQIGPLAFKTRDEADNAGDSGLQREAEPVIRPD
jgi:hypothetical protein